MKSGGKYKNHTKKHPKINTGFSRKIMLYF